MLQGAIIGAIAGLVAVVFIYFNREQRYNKVLKSIVEPHMEYAALFHYASAGKYNKGFKYYDSFGVLYIVGKKAFYKPHATSTPLEFNLPECKAQAEPDWRMLKWFSITAPTGEKHYFNSNKMGLFKANSEETMKGLAAIKAKMSS